MTIKIETPPVLSGAADAQLRQVYAYLYRLSEHLNLALSALEQPTASATNPVAGGKPTADPAAQTYHQLHALVVNTADGIFGKDTIQLTQSVIGELQKALTDGNMAIDGLAGMETSTGVAQWQQTHNRPVTGRTDSSELRLMLSVAADKYPADENWWDRVAHFSMGEFRCKCGRYCDGFPVRPNHLLIEQAEQVRARFGVPVYVSSGVRCERHNANVGGAEGSRHKSGKAMDFRVEGQSAKTVLGYVKTLPKIRYAYAIDGSFVHMDVE